MTDWHANEVGVTTFGARVGGGIYEEPMREFTAGVFRQGKKLRDTVHDYIRLSPAAADAVDTAPIQRLRGLKQLGLTNIVYPAAEHTRFPHSLGVGHLAREVVQDLAAKQPGLELRPRDAQMLELAGLCHDLGHGPLSHVFELMFLPALGQRRGQPLNWSHEEMSGELVELVFTQSGLDWDSESVQRVKDLISFGKLQPKCSWEGRRFLTQIVANVDNGIDVDKIDYLARDTKAAGVPYCHDFRSLLEDCRVVDDYVCFPDTMRPKITLLFEARAGMHGEVYGHRKVKAIEYMVVDALLEADESLRISQRIGSPQDFLGLTDSLLDEIQRRRTESAGLEAAAHILDRLMTRRLYRWCAEVDVPGERVCQYDAVTEEEVVACQDHNLRPEGGLLRSEDIAVNNFKINKSSTSQAPLAGVRLYSRNGDWRWASDTPVCPTEYIQRKVRVYLKRVAQTLREQEQLVRAVQSAFGAAMRRRYGPSVLVSCEDPSRPRFKPPLPGPWWAPAFACGPAAALAILQGPPAGAAPATAPAAPAQAATGKRPAPCLVAGDKQPRLGHVLPSNEGDEEVYCPSSQVAEEVPYGAST